MNHLIIGLGGTGGKIIRSFRKLVYNEFRSENSPNVNIGYLYIDSSDELMKRDDPSWKILGYSVQLPPASQLRITGENLAARLANIDRYPGIRPWIGDPQIWGDILGSIVGAALGGQKRRLGRFLFACKVAEFRQQIQGLVKSLQGRSVDVTFHVIAGLAGGTGSGSVVDIVAQLREIYPDSRYRILVYALVPEQHPNANWDTGNYHANGYAALVELNALSTGAYRPHDITGTKERLFLSDPFNGAYVFSNENDNGYQADIDAEVPGVVAEFLYQKIIVAQDGQWRSLDRMENAENGDGTPETTPGKRVGERSKRFLAFGIKRIAIPEQEIKEYLTLNFARQAILQLRYNNWDDSVGFLDDERNQDLASFLQQADVMQRWSLTDDHLTLSVGILPEDANSRWKTIVAEWDAVMPHFKSAVWQQADRRGRLDELAKLCQRRFDNDYRGVGVPTFYRTKERARHDMAREIRGKIEREIFDDWYNGTRSLHDVAKLIDTLIDSLNERLIAVGDRLQQLRQEEEEYASRLLSNTQRWSSLGLVSRAVGAHANLFDEYAANLQEREIRRTKIHAWGFAKVLLADVVNEVTDLKSDVDKGASALKEALKVIESGVHQRVTDGTGADLKSYLIRYYDPQLVRKVTRNLMLMPDLQTAHAARIRKELVSRLGSEPTFKLLNDRIDMQNLLDVLETNSEQKSREAHTNLVQPADQILGVSIIQKLKEQYGNNIQELRGYVARLVAEAGAFITFNSLEINKVAPGIPTGVPPFIAKMMVILPKAPGNQDFVGKLKDAFRSAYPGDMEFIESDQRKSEIVLVALKNLFPLRFLQILPFLQERYNQRLAINPGRFRLEVHAEGDGSAFPSLFVATADEIQIKGSPYLLLADGLGFIFGGADPRSGENEIILVTKDADGVENRPISLGTSLANAAKRLDSVQLTLLQNAVEAALEAPENNCPDGRRKINDAILMRLDETLKAVGNNRVDETYLRMLDASKAAMRRLRREGV